ncbi:phosphate/phosphite/phosphonate ABC transporter substrate-binding protein [Paludibaculum fermentans]|uniref:PhnD/SsuA/transferrin family substrate-binding protein n=1 Tax=Paludibaculum fermentans TaxID=1473598 RepID=A0A7S7NTV6_PALFE|nr:PhnD/SsuA/transferrin family substrate-binding protein [Paludibaculum fermentans]QOY89606.1 PhnD/SsuA/transferrin family substrate-binding protein [Paludibaculum fermentans]
MTLRQKSLLLLVVALPGMNVRMCAGDGTGAAGLTRTYLRVSASESVFATVNQADAIASMKVWSEQLGKLRGFQLDAKVAIALSIPQMRQSLKDHMVDLLVLDTPDYLVLSETNLLDAVFAGTERGQLAVYQYLLLTNDSSGAVTLPGLRQKRVVISSRTKSNLGLMWLETLLGDSRLGRAGAFFSSVEINYRSSQCVMPLFFRRIDACVVDSGNWEAMKELNPQLGRLRVVARSEPYLEGVVAMPLQPHPHQDELVASLLNLHKTPAGEQLGIVFRIGPLVRASKAQFESVRVLRNKYRHIVEASSSGLGPALVRLEDAAGKGHP